MLPLVVLYCRCCLCCGPPSPWGEMSLWRQPRGSTQGQRSVAAGRHDSGGTVFRWEKGTWSRTHCQRSWCPRCRKHLSAAFLQAGGRHILRVQGQGRGEDVLKVVRKRFSGHRCWEKPQCWRAVMCTWRRTCRGRSESSQHHLVGHRRVRDCRAHLRRFMREVKRGNPAATVCPIMSHFTVTHWMLSRWPCNMTSCMWTGNAMCGTTSEERLSSALA